MAARLFPRYRGMRWHLSMLHERAPEARERPTAPPAAPLPSGEPEPDARRRLVPFTVVARRPARAADGEAGAGADGA